MELQGAFLFKKRLLFEIISKVAARKCSLKWSFISNISKISGKPSVVRCFLARIQRSIYSFGRVPENFLKFFRAAFLTLSTIACVEQKTFQKQLSGGVLKYFRILPGKIPSWSALLAKIEKSTPPRIFSVEFFRIFENTCCNIFEQLHL